MTHTILELVCQASICVATLSGSTTAYELPKSTTFRAGDIVTLKDGQLCKAACTFEDKPQPQPTKPVRGLW